VTCNAAEVSFRWGSLMGEKRIRRSSYGGARPHRDLPFLAPAYLDRRLLLDELITARIRLDAINTDFERRAAATESVAWCCLIDQLSMVLRAKLSIYDISASEACAAAAPSRPPIASARAACSVAASGRSAASR
jgi:hypothetical protein